jgi:GNAT superfamily N-acetyltransferase
MMSSADANAPVSVISCRAMGAGDLARIVEIHQRSFPEFFLTSLGPGFLHLFYSAAIRFQPSVALSGYMRDTLAGFVVGVPDHRAFHAFLRRHYAFRAGICATRAILQRPGVLARCLRRYGSSGPQLPNADGALLMSIAVDPACAGAGLGKCLLKAFAAELAVRGFHEFRLTTDRDRNANVNRFYQEAGLILETTHRTPEGRWLNQYVFRPDKSRG